MTDEQIKQMVERFLSWKLPQPWYPDGGIKFTPVGNEGTAHEYRREPIGTNLFDYTQAEAMVRHMLEGIEPFSKEWCINMAKQEGDSDIAAGLTALDPTPAQEGNEK